MGTPQSVSRAKILLDWSFCIIHSSSSVVRRSIVSIPTRIHSPQPSRRKSKSSHLHCISHFPFPFPAQRTLRSFPSQKKKPLIINPKTKNPDKQSKMLGHNLFNGNGLSQVTREIDVEPFGDSEPVRHELKGNDVQEALEAVNCLWDFDFFGLPGFEFFVGWVANYDWLAVTGNDCLSVISL